MTLLDPNSRSLYTAALTPPPGAVFDEAIGTSFSLDPAFLLEAPVYLALAASGGERQTDPLALLIAIKNYAERITVYVQRGRVLVPRGSKPSPLYGHLERMIVEVTAPSGGVFHPKLWLIRFVDHVTGAARYRLVVLSRNMTTDNSWDLALRLDGDLLQSSHPGNEPLANLVRSLPTYATGSVDEARRNQATRLADELLHIDWELPAGFERLSFYLPATEHFSWVPPNANKLAVISPFCSDEPLQELANRTRSAVALVSTPEALASLKAETLALFDSCLYLDEAAETDDGEDESVDDGVQPNYTQSTTALHAKAYLFETKHWVDHTHVVMGSANATNSALTAGRNIEVLVELVGKTRNVGSISDLLGADGLGEYLTEYEPATAKVGNPLIRQAELTLEAARALLAGAGLRVRCTSATETDTFELKLSGAPALPVGISHAEAWPITMAAESAVSILASAAGGPVPLGKFATASVTGLIAFRLVASNCDTRLAFVLNLPLDGLPAERDAAILHTLIRNREGFIRYLLMLLSDETYANLTTVAGSKYESWFRRMVAGEAVPLLEELTRAFGQSPEKLTEIAELVKSLTTSSQDSVIPAEFARLWSVFEEALAERDD